LDQPSDCTIEDKRSHYLLLRDDAYSFAWRGKRRLPSALTLASLVVRPLALSHQWRRCVESQPL